MDDQTHFHRLAYTINSNARDLGADLEWLAQALHARLADYFAAPSRSPELPGETLPPPDLSSGDSPYANLLKECRLSSAERLVLLLGKSVV